MGQFLTTQTDEVKAALEKGRVLLGIACYVLAWVGYPSPDPDFIPLRRLYRADIDDYLYTTSQVEADSAVQHAGYVFETIACNVWNPNQPLPPNWNLFPLLRLYNPQTGEHFYTTQGETAQAIMVAQRLKAGFQSETSPGFVNDPYQGVVPAWDVSMPLYRLSHIGATLPQFTPWWNTEVL